MGHANLKNISEFFIKRLYAKGKLSIKDCVEAMVKAGVTLNASEGSYDDCPMLSFGLEEVVGFLRTFDSGNYSLHGDTDKLVLKSPAIVPVSLTEEQEKILKQADSGDTDDWDSGDDGCSGQYGVFDSIEWKFAPGWRKQYPEIPLLCNYTN